MQTIENKSKTTIGWLIILTIVLFIVSITLIVFINIAKNKISEQQSQIEQLEQTINKNSNPPSNNDQTIIPGGNEWL